MISGLLASCNKAQETVDLNSMSSWEIVQNRVFNQSCITCHKVDTAYCRQSNLVLTSDFAYDQLVRKKPSNKAALKDGLYRVDPGNVENSLLWKKITMLTEKDGKTVYQSSDYGNSMPYGGLKPLTNGQIEFIRRWIEAKAPKTGKVVNVSVLDDKSVLHQEYIPLERPKNGIQIHLGPFPVKPNFEREFMYLKILDNKKPIYLKGIQLSMRPGSHHFIIYQWDSNLLLGEVPTPNLYREMRDSEGRENKQTVRQLLSDRHRTVENFQTPTAWYKYPKGVALKIDPNAMLDLNIHYTNYTSKEIQGEVMVNLELAKHEEIKHIARTFTIANFEILLPSKSKRTLTYSKIFDEKRHVFRLVSHAHERMKEFRAFILGGKNDGKLVYKSNDWKNPQFIDYDPPITLKKGEGFRLEVDYENDTDRTITFGLLSTDEMMFLQGHYYTDEKPIFNEE